ncbi:MAG TPA: iron-containing alcohol dehydrogenase [Verrucomicrobiales bacterium]|nr:iron-containing alcohol dehydrogenase [Verrucomicrobiales bacterium]
MTSVPLLTVAALLDKYCGQGVPEFVRDFTHAPGTKVVFGNNAVDRAGIFARTLGAQRVLIVTDRGIAEAGHLERVIQSLGGAGVEWSAFMGVTENPTTDTVDDCVASAREMEADLLIGLGGGSSMDTAKGCNFLFTNGGRMSDYQGTGKATKPMLPLIAIPTTAGTGSECQSYALISDAVTHAKMACGDKKAAARIAILDPLLTLSQPPRVTRVTGIDAIAHAVESAVCNRRTEISLANSRAAFALLANAFPKVIADPADLEARAAMLLGAALSGVAIENSMLGAAHSSANPLTAHFGTVHGEAVGMMLPHVVRYNSSDPGAAETYGRLAVSAGGAELPDVLTSLLMAAGLPVKMEAGTLTSENTRQLAAEAAGQWTAQFNPVPVSTEDFVELYRKVI